MSANRPQDRVGGPVATAIPPAARSSLLGRSGGLQAHSRLPDWPERLAAHLDRWRARPFGWGDADCARFAEGAVLAVTGRRVAIGPTWCDLDSARGVLRLLGGLVRAVDEHLPRVPLPYAQRGDVVLVRGPAHRHLAVIDGAGGWVAPGAAGLVRGPLVQARLAWGVGHG